MQLWIFLYVLCSTIYIFLSFYYDPDVKLKGKVV